MALLETQQTALDLENLFSDVATSLDQPTENTALNTDPTPEEIAEHAIELCNQIEGSTSLNEELMTLVKRKLFCQIIYGKKSEPITPFFISKQYYP
jgi:hypothetical protein